MAELVEAINKLNQTIASGFEQLDETIGMSLSNIQEAVTESGKRTAEWLSAIDTSLDDLGRDVSGIAPSVSSALDSALDPITRALESNETTQRDLVDKLGELIKLMKGDQPAREKKRSKN